ncbi:hypothetical protein V2J09_013356 [Rumex salicifolius]
MKGKLWKQRWQTVKASRWSLNGRTALVTAGCKGIGHAIVEELSELGATVAQRMLEALEMKGFNVTGYAFDVSSREQRENLIKTVSSELNGKLDILINCFALSIYKPTPDYSAEELSMITAANIESTFHLCQLAHPLLSMRMSMSMSSSST